MHDEEFSHSCLLFHYGELSGEEKAAFEGHLKHCPECQAAIQGLEAADSWFESSAREPSAAVLEELASSLESREEEQAIPAVRRWFLYPAFAFTAALVLAVVYWRPHEDSSVIPPWTNGVEDDLQRLGDEMEGVDEDFGFDVGSGDDFSDRMERVETRKKTIESEIKGGI